MRVSALLLVSSLVLAAGSTPGMAQLSGGVGSSNSANQSFQLQNSIRGIQQQQTFDNNQNRLQIQTNQMNAGPRNTGPYLGRRRFRHR